MGVFFSRFRPLYEIHHPEYQVFFSNSLDLSAPEEAYSRNVRASGTLKFGYESVFKITPVNIVSGHL